MNHTPLIMGLSLLCIVALAVAGCTGQAPAEKGKDAITPAGTAVPAGTVVVTEAQNNATVNMKAGDTLIVSLPENGTTGYLWNMTVSPGLAIVDDTFVSSDKAGTLVGAGGTRTWTIKVNNAGSQWVKGVYMRSWEPVTGSDTTFTLTVVAGA